MGELAQEVVAYFQQRPVIYLVVAFVAGFAASKSVAYAGKGNFFLYLIVGLVGFFLGQYAILVFGLKDIINQLPAFRLLFDFIAAYVGAFLVAAIIHFVKPL